MGSDSDADELQGRVSKLEVDIVEQEHRITAIFLRLIDPNVKWNLRNPLFSANLRALFFTFLGYLLKGGVAATSLASIAISLFSLFLLSEQNIIQKKQFEIERDSARAENKHRLYEILYSEPKDCASEKKKKIRAIKFGSKIYQTSVTTDSCVLSQSKIRADAFVDLYDAETYRCKVGKRCHPQDLTGINMNYATVKNAKFNGADFSYSTFDHAVFIGVEMKASLFCDVDMNRASYILANFSRSRFCDRTNAKNSNFYGSDFDDAKFISSNFSGSCFVHSRMKNALFENVNLSDAKFAYADISGANFSKALEIKPEQFLMACGNSETVFPENFDVDLSPCEQDEHNNPNERADDLVAKAYCDV